MPLIGTFPPPLLFLKRPFYVEETQSCHAFPLDFLGLPSQPERRQRVPVRLLLRPLRPPGQKGRRQRQKWHLELFSSQIRPRHGALQGRRGGRRRGGGAEALRLRKLVLETIRLPKRNNKLLLPFSFFSQPLHFCSSAASPRSFQRATGPADRGGSCSASPRCQVGERKKRIIGFFLKLNGE